MYEAVNRNNERICGYFSEDDLTDHLDEISVPDDFWYVYRDGRLAYYYRPYPAARGIGAVNTAAGSF